MSGHQDLALIVLACGAVVVALVRSRWRWAVLGLALVAAALLLADTGSWNSCILAGTMVETPSGPRAIETLRVGDPVLSLREDGATAISTVAATRTAVVDSYLSIELADGRMLNATGSHPLACGNGWREATRVRVGDRLRGCRGEVGIVRVAWHERRVSVCDLTVVPHANFFAAGVLVHNKTRILPGAGEEVSRHHLRGAWIGTAHATSCLFVFGDNEQGRCALRNDDDIRLFHVTRWDLDGREITVELQAEGSSDHWTLHGSVGPRVLLFVRGEGDREPPLGLVGLELFPEWMAEEGMRERFHRPDVR